jgi:hypothetical protein
MEAGRSRGNHWSFWKDNVGIFEPSKGGRKWNSKYRIRTYSGKDESDKKITIELKRMPHRWIPEFNQF